MRHDLLGGADTRRSVIANNIRCINYYPEKNREDSIAPYTYYQRPGLKKLKSPPIIGAGRSVLRDSQGNGYAVVGQNIYSLDQYFNFTLMGELKTNLTTPVSMSDNGTNAVLGDGSPFGYTWTIGSPVTTFANIRDVTGTFTGTTTWAFLDSFLLWIFINSNLFGSTHSGSPLTFDPLYVAAKNGYPDNLVGMIVNYRIIILFGEVKSEIWYDAGNAQFPFAIQSGAYIEWGCIAPYSICNIGKNVFWLGQGTQGAGLVLMQEGYNTEIVSNNAISYAITEMIQNGVDISDTTGYTYTQDGHIFYVLTFIGGNQTWVYDYTIGDPTMAWHQRAYTDANGNLNRERCISAAFLNNMNVTMDWQNGDLYQLDLDYFNDDVNGVSGPISYIKGFSQLKMVYPTPAGQTGFQRYPIQSDGHAVQTFKFVADFEGGNGPVNPNGLAPQIGLKWSKDRGKTWLNNVLQSAGVQGKYETQPVWRSLGIARYPLFELSHSIPAKAALNGAWLEAVYTDQ